MADLLAACECIPIRTDQALRSRCCESLDRGCRYTSAAYAALAEENQVTLSGGRTGQQCWDNALAESFFSSLKGELICTRAWPTRVGANRAVVEYIAWYNHVRRHSSLGYLSPADYENNHRENVRRVA
jgi:putative transposase